MLTSHPDVTSWPSGTVCSNVLENLSSTSQEINPDEGRATISQFSFSVVDKNQSITSALHPARGAAWRARPRGARLRGRRTSAPPSTNSSARSSCPGFARVAAATSSVAGHHPRDTHEDHGTASHHARGRAHRHRHHDDRGQLRRFERYYHGTSYTLNSGQTRGYLKRSNRPAKSSATAARPPPPSPGCSAASLAPSPSPWPSTRLPAGAPPGNRGVRLPRDAGAEAHPRPDDRGALRRQREAAGALARGRFDELGARGGLSQLRPRLLGARDDAKGLPVRFIGIGGEEAKRFIETELLKLLDAVQPEYPDGTVGLRRLTRVSSAATPVAWVATDDIIEVSDLDHHLGTCRTSTCSGGTGTAKFTRRNVLYDATSANIHNKVTKIVELKFRGLHGSRITLNRIEQLLDLKRDRYGAPPIGCTLTMRARGCHSTSPRSFARRFPASRLHERRHLSRPRLRVSERRPRLARPAGAGEALRLDRPDPAAAAAVRCHRPRGWLLQLGRDRSRLGLWRHDHRRRAHRGAIWRHHRRGSGTPPTRCSTTWAT